MARRQNTKEGDCCSKQDYQYSFVRQSDIPTKSHPDWSGFFVFLSRQPAFSAIWLGNLAKNCFPMFTFCNSAIDLCL
ncbi:MAG: hypothetical protein J6X32_10030, partial [Salinivirgaceae bacterium]|nr:hypothetical protein [Salinivirgaceae bacterium]